MKPSGIDPPYMVDENKEIHIYGGRNNVWKQWKYLGPTLKQLVRGSSPRSVT
jgi:hypothetical protein